MDCAELDSGEDYEVQAENCWEERSWLGLR